jgi:hypothetical protein
MNAASLTQRSLRLAAMPHETRPRCQTCTLLRVFDTATGPTWRCEVCLRYEVTIGPAARSVAGLFDGDDDDESESAARGVHPNDSRDPHD